jgi:hypothetical protein
MTFSCSDIFQSSKQSSNLNLKGLERRFSIKRDLQTLASIFVSVHGLDLCIGPPNPERAPRYFIVDILSTIIRSREMWSKGMLRKVED